MKETKGNENYACTIISLKEVNTLPNMDNLVSTNIFGYSVLVGKNIPLGTLMAFFPAESRLSPKLLAENNLYRDGTLNKDATKKGYISDSGRVKAEKMRGNISNGLLLDLTALSIYGNVDFKEGDTFDFINGEKVCEKYEIPLLNGKQEITGKPSKKDVIVDKKLFPEHYDSSNYFKYKDWYDGENNVIITQKLHGTSCRIGNVLVKQKLSIWQKIKNFFGAKIPTEKYCRVAGSRRVTKSVDGKAISPDGKSYYAEDVYTQISNEIKFISGNIVIFGEIVGKLNSGAFIQKGYTYGFEKPTLFVYRICEINPETKEQIEWSWDDVKAWCKYNDIRYVPEFERCKLKDVDMTKYENKFYYKERDNAVFCENYDEGVVVRLQQTSTPTFLKAKFSEFLSHETKLLNEGVQIDS